MKPRHIAMGAALVLAAGLLVFGDNAPEASLAEPVERAARAPATSTASAGSKASAAARATTTPGDGAILRLLPRDTLIGDDERFGAGANALFARQDWTPPPPPPPPNLPPPPPPPPSAPPLPFTYIGKSLQDGVWEVYLAQGERTYLVRDKTTIDGLYRVDAIRPPVLTLTYLPLAQVQQINIGVFE